MDDTSGRLGETDGLDDDARRRATQLRAEIAGTREELSETVEAIQEKLRPANIVASATDQVKRATTERVRNMAHAAEERTRGMVSQTKRAAGDMMDHVRRRPMSAALLGFGAVWLLTYASRRRWNGFSDYDSRRSRTDDSWIDDGYETAEYGILERLRDNPIPAALCGIGLTWLATSDRGRRVQRSYIGGEYDVASVEEYDVSPVEESSRVMDTARRAGDTARRAGEKVQQYASDATATVRRTTRHAQTQLQRVINENPLMVGAGALVLGAAVGLSLPETEHENEWMGETRDNLVEHAQDVARSAVSTVQDAAGNVADEVVKRALGGEQG
jgi:ElaB/YqjD/DUF883 family membrane-anchored ribosome-binding protein